MLGKNTLILGFGREGVSTLNYLLSKKADQPTTITIYDKREVSSLSNQAQTLLQNNLQVKRKFGEPLSTLNFKYYDRIIKSPGIPNKDLSNDLRNKITSQTQIFMDQCPTKIIGVTGTKGKSTTASLIHAICRAAGKPSILLGNIGIPPLDSLEQITSDSVVILELSSHQLSTLHTSPHIAVLLGIFPEHLDYYASMDEYVAAKANITKFQTSADFLIFNSENALSTKVAHDSAAQQIPITPNLIAHARSLLQGAQLQGEMNAINTAAASEVCRIIGIDIKDIKMGIKKFHSLDHRLEKVGEYRGITFYNDSLSTIPQATIAGLSALGNRVSTVILGGYDRNLSYHILAKDLLSRPNVKNLIFFPTTGQKIWDEIKGLQFDAEKKFNIAFVTTMKDAVSFAYKRTMAGEICLLSPGATSFETFIDYRDRGNQFKEQVKKLSV